MILHSPTNYVDFKLQVNAARREGAHCVMVGRAAYNKYVNVNFKLWPFSLFSFLCQIREDKNMVFQLKT